MLWIGCIRNEKRREKWQEQKHNRHRGSEKVQGSGGLGETVASRPEKGKPGAHFERTETTRQDKRTFAEAKHARIRFSWV